MFILIHFFFTLFSTIVQCQNIPISFPTFQAETDIGLCTCDLTINICDISCCCDPDCSTSDKAAFQCSSRVNQYTKNRIKEIINSSTPFTSALQQSCFKDISIFKSESPYIIQKMGELVCLDYIRYVGGQYYRTPTIQTVNSDVFVRAINAEKSVTAPLGLSTGASSYQVGTAILTYDKTRNVPSYYSLPTKLFNNARCSGSQPIAYMKDFTSTCSQLVSSDTCNGALNPLTYINSLCLIRSPASPFDNSTYVCDNTTASTSTFGSSCTNALQSLIVTIFYSNPTGIVALNVAYTTANPSNGTLFSQTFAVRFVQNGSSPLDVPRNPGYLQDANIISSVLNGSGFQSISSSLFSIVKPPSTGFCNDITERIPIRFGESVQSTCLLNVSSLSTCSGFFTLLMPITSTDLYVAAYSNPNYLNSSTDWLRVISCTSQIGSLTTPDCRYGILNSTGVSVCYTRLDIQIAYTNIGSVTNPQHVLSAVIFNYQYETLSSNTRFIIETVTFQDISAAPVIIQGQIPTPDTRLPANFLYPFSVSHATKSKILDSFSYLLLSMLFILM